MSHIRPAQELAVLIRKEAQRAKRQASLEVDLGTVNVEANGDLEVSLNSTNITLDEELLGFASTCPPSLLNDGDTVVVVEADGEHVVLAAVAFEDEADRQATTGIRRGMMVEWPALADVPAGFLECDGTTFSRTTYPELYELLGNSNVLPPALPTTAPYEGIIRIIRA